MRGLTAYEMERGFESRASGADLPGTLGRSLGRVFQINPFSVSRFTASHSRPSLVLPFGVFENLGVPSSVCRGRRVEALEADQAPADVIVAIDAAAERLLRIVQVERP